MTKSLVSALLLLAAMTMVEGAEVVKLTPTQLERICSHAVQEVEEGSPLWIVRFVVPWEDSEKEIAAFAEAAAQVPTVIAQFGTFEVDSVDSIAMVDAFQLASFPTVRAFGARLGRPEVPKGALQTARVLRFDSANTYGGARTDVTQLVNWVLMATPNRYEHPVTGAVQPTVSRVQSLGELKGLSHAANPKTSVPLVVFFGSLSDTPLALLATLNSQGARLRDRVLIAFCSSSPLAREYGVSLGNAEGGMSAVVLRANQNGDLVASAKREGLRSPESVSDFLSEVSLPFDAYAATVAEELASWQDDVAAFVSNSPLRRLDTMEQLKREVLAKHSVTLLFLLRESDKFFARHESVAVGVAKFQTEYHHTSLATGEPLAARMPCNVYWIDAEVHPDIAKALGATQVPSIAIILPLKDDMIGVKFFVDGKDFPTADKLNRFTQSEQLIETKDIRPLNVDALRFNSKLPTRAASADQTNKRYLNVDHRDYGKDVEPPNLLQEAIVAAEEAAKEAAKPSAKKLSPKAEQKRAAAEEARKEKLRAELERKQKEREERMRAKAEKDAADRAAQAAEAAKKREEEEALRKATPSEPKPKKAKKKKPQPKATVRKQKPPRDLMEELQRWDAESRLMAAKYVQISPDGKTVNVIHSLTPPSTSG